MAKARSLAPAQHRRRPSQYWRTMPKSLALAGESVAGGGLILSQTTNKESLLWIHGTARRPDTCRSVIDLTVSWVVIWTHVNLSQKLLTYLSLDVAGRLN